MSENGFKIDGNGNSEIESLKVRSFLETAELEVSRETIFSKGEVTPIDKRAEFLGRLQSLLREFDACVIPRCAVSGTYERGLRLMVGNDEIVYRSRNELNADNIMDFEKE